MGISTIRSYRGAKLFEAVGLNAEMMKRYFGTDISTIGGAGLKDIASDYLKFHESGASISEDEAASMLDNIGLFSYRKDGESMHGIRKPSVCCNWLHVREVTRSSRSSLRRQTKKNHRYSCVISSASATTR